MIFASFVQVALFTTCLASPFKPTKPWGNNSDYGRPKGGYPLKKTSFDYVIAGGGLTGLTVASKLTEDPDVDVLVIEGGEDDHQDPRVYDVRTYGEAFNSDLDYNLTSIPIVWQNDTGLQLVAGHTLGGSGSINGASWTKGAKSQYDLLPLLTGDESWAWEPFNRYMLEAENFNPPSANLVAKGSQFQPDAHGSGGPVQVSFAQGMFSSIQLPALEASEKVWDGLERVMDFANGTVNGASIIPNMVDPDTTQLRSSPYTAYALQQSAQRQNFVILTGHRVVQIVWQKRHGAELVAAGVKFQACPSCPVQFVRAKQEVLLAAGSLQSPQILELSGVGDPSVLENAGIPLVKAAPGVGKNLQEQTKNSLYLTPVSTDFNGTGPSSAIAFPNAYQLLEENAVATYESILESLPQYVTELESSGLVVNGSAALTIITAQVNDLFKDNASAAEIFFTLNSATGQVGIDLWNLIVLSRGTAHIRSSNSWDHPVVDPSYFGHHYDLQIQIAATKQSREVFQTDPLSSYVVEETFPGTAVAQDAGDEQWEEWVKSTFTSVWHYIATLSMMKEEYGGVVDSRFLVYGIRNVRAIDASVLPIQLSAHLSSSLYGIALKAAEVIKQDSRNREA